MCPEAAAERVRVDGDGSKMKCRGLAYTFNKKWSPSLGDVQYT